MIYKIYFQENPKEAPVRENTKVLFVYADSERDARKKVADRNINIELVRLVDGDYLEYEKQNEDFKVLEI